MCWCQEHYEVSWWSLAVFGGLWRSLAVLVSFWLALLGAVCATHVEGHQAGPRMLLHALRHYVLQVKIILVDFNLALSTLTANPRQV